MSPSTITAPLVGKYAIITGGSKGIGASIALTLAQKGCSAIAITYSTDAASATQVLSQLKSLGVENCAAIQANLLDQDFGTKIITGALRELQTEHIDIIVNNAFYAGPDEFQPFESQSFSAFNNMMHGNVWGPMLLIRASLPHIRPGGRVINISSTASRRHNIDPLVVYGATKAAIESVTRSLAIMYGAEKGITVNSVSVGPTNTEPGRMSRAFPGDFQAMLRNRVSKEKDLAEPEDVADIVAFLASQDSRWVNGSCVMANGGCLLD